MIFPGSRTSALFNVWVPGDLWFSWRVHFSWDPGLRGFQDSQGSMDPLGPPGVLPYTRASKEKSCRFHRIFIKWSGSSLVRAYKVFTPPEGSLVPFYLLAQKLPNIDVHVFLTFWVSKFRFKTYGFVPDSLS